ncbi:MAG TPA: NUDIX hydrolase [Thermoanaerobaculia bacterium]
MAGLAGAMLNDEITPLPAASAIVLREPFELLMMRRHAGASFMPNAWVFPGGIAEDLDHQLGGLQITAVRETFEETGVWLGSAPLDDAEHKRRRLLAGSISVRQLLAEAPIDPDALVLTSRWITPVGVPKRFDTYFYLAKAPPGTIATAENHEAVDVTWIHPEEALAKHAAREMQMVFPTLRNLEALRGFDSVDALIESRRGITVEPVMPVLVDGKPTLR